MNANSSILVDLVMINIFLLFRINFGCITQFVCERWFGFGRSIGTWTRLVRTHWLDFFPHLSHCSQLNFFTFSFILEHYQIIGTHIYNAYLFVPSRSLVILLVVCYFVSIYFITSS